MLTAAELASIRGDAALVLTDTGSVSRSAASGQVWDPATETYTQPAGTTIFTGACRVRPKAASENVVQAGDQPVSLRTYDATLPWSATGVKVDDILTVTASTDPDLIGRPLRVMDVAYGSMQVLRRLMVEDSEG